MNNTYVFKVRQVYEDTIEVIAPTEADARALYPSLPDRQLAVVVHHGLSLEHRFIENAIIEKVSEREGNDFGY